MSKSSEGSVPKAPRANLIVVRNSRIHGRGVYAARAIRAGERILEYTGRRITWKQADRLPPSDPDDPNHTFLFSLSDGKHVIDASEGGNAGRFINHSCDPNCETEETDDGHVFVEALRDIARGEELVYDYLLFIDGGKVSKKQMREHACRCGSSQCRGTMLALPKKQRKKAIARMAKQAEKAARAQAGQQDGAGAKKAAKGKKAAGTKAPRKAGAPARTSTAKKSAKADAGASAKKTRSKAAKPAKAAKPVKGAKPVDVNAAAKAPKKASKRTRAKKAA